MKPIEIDIHGKKIWVSPIQANLNHYQFVQEGCWEPNTFNIFDTFLDEEHSYFDIGSWIGITSLYGAQIAKHCYSFEPDPVAYQAFQDNLALNPKVKDKITLTNKCISDSCGEVILGNNTSVMGGDSISSLLFTNAKVIWKVPATTIEAYIKENSIRDLNFIKIDIEGGEAIVLPSIKALIEKTKPTLFVAIHPLFYGPNISKYLAEIIQVLGPYKHIFIANGKEVDVSVISRIRSFYEIVATDIPIEAFKKTEWSKNIKALA